MDFSTPTIDLIKSGLNNAQTVNSDQVLYNRIKESGDSKEQLRKAATEFESIFVTKMLSEMDKTVDHENGLFGKESQYVDTFKSIISFTLICVFFHLSVNLVCKSKACSRVICNITPHLLVNY